VEGKLTVEKIKKLENGVDIGEKKLTMPAKVEIVGGSWEGAGEPEPGRVRRENLPEVYTELHLTIHEGKFHQVKRMMAAVETPVIYLKRISMGPLILPDDLKKGECRSLTDEELRKLKT
jgi:16S rRNA pseudouridine516 synthase